MYKVGDEVVVQTLDDVKDEHENWAKNDGLLMYGVYVVTEVTDDGWLALEGHKLYHHRDRFRSQQAIELEAQEVDRHHPLWPEDPLVGPADFHAPGETLRYNDGKAQLSYILEFGRALDLISGVMERGALKYERKNWALGGKNVTLESLMDSTMRHLKDRMDGKVYDTESGHDVLAHAACGILFALYHHGQEPEGE